MQGRPAAWLTFPRFAALTAGLTLALMSLGVYTAASAAGLACSAQWPLCDGGLLPRTLPSFVEWSHRLVAMVTGLFILGTAAWAWRAGGRRTALAATVAAALLPLQVSIGAVTVTLNGALPSGYSPPTQAAHLAVALCIFGALVVTTLLAATGRGDGARPPADGLRVALVGALLALPPSALLSRLTLAVPYSPGVQALFYALSLGVVAALLAAVLFALRAGRPRVLALAAGALALLVVHLLLGRDLVYYTATVRVANAAVLVAAVAATALGVRAAYATESREGDRGGTLAD